MLTISAKTKLTPEQAIKRAVGFFGPGGCGLEIKDQAPTGLCFEGGGGRVEVVACAEGKGSSVELISQEWDYQVKEFARKLPR